MEGLKMNTKSVLLLLLMLCPEIGLAMEINKQTTKIEALSEDQVRALELEFIQAAQDGNTRKVQELLDLGVNKNACDEQGNTAQIWAIKNNHIEIAKLLGQKSTINKRTQQQFRKKQKNSQMRDRYANMALEYALANSRTDILTKALNQKRYSSAAMQTSPYTLNYLITPDNDQIIAALENASTAIKEIIQKELENRCNLQEAAQQPTINECAPKGDQLKIDEKKEDTCSIQ
jgi:ankyrin repeat protein